MGNANPLPVEYSGTPLGGLGTGSVEIRGDGHFHDWQIMNNKPWGNGPATAEMEDEGLFFGIVAHDGTRPRELMLNRPKWLDRDAYGSSEIFKWTLDPYHMPWMEFPSDISYDGRFPFANLGYEAKGYPIAATMEAFCPFIPLDAKNSGLPVIFMTFSLRNVSRRKQRVSLFGVMKNCVGYDYPKHESVIRFQEKGRAAWLEFDRKDMPREAQSAGSAALGLWSKKAGKVSYFLHAAHPRDIYDPLMETGHLENRDRSDYKGTVGNDLGAQTRAARVLLGCSRGVIAKTMALKPGETAQVTFALAWHFPNMAQKECRGGEPTQSIGHQYDNWFGSATEVFAYGQKNFDDLRRRSREFVDAYYETTADRWVLDAIAAQLTTFPKSAWWDRSGRFAIWEGLGCCGLQTLDITIYGSFPIILFFPELQKKQMEMVTVTANTIGRPPHAFGGTFSECCIWRNNRIDNDVQFALLVWRDALWTGDTDYIKRIWPALEIFLADIEKTDANGDGLPDNAGIDQSYDQFPLYGTSAYVGMQYVGALKAASELAQMIGLSARADELAVRAAKAFVTVEKQLWNGEYYELSFDKGTGKGNAGCMADQLCGDWFVRQTDGDGLADITRAKAALSAVFRYCRRPEGYLTNCEWPRGGRVKIRRETSDQARCPWTGVEFAVIAEMLLLGLEREGMTLLRDVWDRHEKIGMRYNHIECGDHYYRAMSSWAVYLAMQGFAWDAAAGSMALKVQGGKKQFVWNTPAAWGRVTMRGGAKAAVEMEVAAGTLKIAELHLTGVKADKVKVTAGGKRVAAQAKLEAGATVIELEKAVSLKKGQRLVVTA